MHVKHSQQNFPLKKFFILAAFVSFKCAAPESSFTSPPMEVRRNNSQESIEVENAAVYRKEVKADAKLNALRWTNEALDEEISHLKVESQNCQNSLADFGVKGSGEVVARDEKRDDPDAHENLEVNGRDDIKFVTKENFKEKMNLEKAKEAKLRTQLEIIKKGLRNCESKLRNAAIKNRSRSK